MKVFDLPPVCLSHWLLLRDVEMTRDHITIQRLSVIGTFFKGTQMIS